MTVPARLRQLLIVLAVLLAVVGILHLRQDDAGAGARLRPPPDIPPLTADELASLPDERLLDRVSAEAMRRVIAGGQGWRSGPQVLPAPMCHLWTVAVLEPAIRQMGFATAMAQDSASSAMVPAMHDLVAAYTELGMAEVAAVVSEAEADVPGSGRLDGRFRAAVDRAGSPARRLAYARAHRGELLGP